jgi:uncharacterized membrane protein
MTYMYQSSSSDLRRPPRESSFSDNSLVVVVCAYTSTSDTLFDRTLACTLNHRNSERLGTPTLVGSIIPTLEAILIPWLVLLHLLGVILWVAGLLSVTLLLSGIGDADKNLRDKVIELAGKLERTLALPGFLLAMVFGFILLFGNALGHSPLRQGWMHMKLTVVLFGMVPIQGLLGARRKKLRTTDDPAKLATSFRNMFFATVMLVVLALFLIETKPANNPTKVQESWFFDSLGNAK